MYRDPVLALEARLAQLHEARAAIDADIEKAERHLSAWRATTPSRFWIWWAALASSVPCAIAMGVVAALLTPPCLLDGCPTSPERTTRARAAALRSAATLYVAQSPRAECPTVERLFAEGYLLDGANITDAWGHDYWIECGGSDVVVRSCSFDGERAIPSRDAD